MECGITDSNEEFRKHHVIFHNNISNAPLSAMSVCTLNSWKKDPQCVCMCVRASVGVCVCVHVCITACSYSRGVLVIKHRASHMLSICSTTEPNPQPPNAVMQNSVCVKIYISSVYFEVNLI